MQATLQPARPMAGSQHCFREGHAMEQPASPRRTCSESATPLQSQMGTLQSPPATTARPTPAANTDHCNTHDAYGSIGLSSGVLAALQDTELQRMQSPSAASDVQAGMRLYSDAQTRRFKQALQSQRVDAQAQAAACSVHAKPLSPHIYPPNTLRGTPERPQVRAGCRHVQLEHQSALCLAVLVQAIQSHSISHAYLLACTREQAQVSCMGHKVTHHDFICSGLLQPLFD